MFCFISATYHSSFGFFSALESVASGRMGQDCISVLPGRLK